MSFGNVLITSAGRRTFLVQAFKAALIGKGQVIAGDIDPLAPSLQLADRGVRLLRLDEPEYEDSLVEISRQFRVRAVIPTIDTELRQLSHASERLKSLQVTAVVSSATFLSITLDKSATMRVFGARGVACARSWLPEEVATATLPHRVVVKPRFGSASQGAFAVRRDLVAHAIALTELPIIQEELTGPEITIDALFDMSSRLIHYVPRVRLKAIGGESVEGVTISSERLGAWLGDVLEACAQLGARGPVTLQCFEEPTGPKLTEINARFGGGFPLSYRAGGHYPEWLIGELEGSTLSPRIGEYETGLRMTRHYVEIFPHITPW